MVAVLGSSIEIKGLDSTSGLEPITSGPGSDEEGCLFASGEWSSEEVRFIGTSSPPYLCRIDLSGLQDAVTKTATRHVEVSVEYDYLFTKSVKVTVNPKITS
jgi:hypothetical protein